MILDKITPIDLHLAQKLRQLRRSFGMTQDRLSELTGLSFQQIQKYEKAKNRIPASRLFEFAQLLEQPVSAFFEGLVADRMYYNYNFERKKFTPSAVVNNTVTFDMFAQTFAGIGKIFIYNTEVGTFNYNVLVKVTDFAPNPVMVDEDLTIYGSGFNGTYCL
jgi:transcriptional regulator with XRE-family HTH domain